MFFNSLNFYNFLQLENSVLVAKEYYVYSPKLNVKFLVSVSNKLNLLQTVELTRQFFALRPFISSIAKSDGKSMHLNVISTIQGRGVIKFFSLLFSAKSSLRRKLITINFKINGDVFIKFNDFITLHPFKIRFYDFYGWRKQFIIGLKIKDSFPLLNEKFTVINFYSIFFRNPHYGQIK